MEEIGLKAVLDDKDFQRGIKDYQDSLDDATDSTEDFSEAAGDASTGGIDDLNTGVGEVGDTSESTTGKMTDLWSGLQMGMAIAEKVVDVIDELVNGTIDYGMEVKDLSMLLGVSAEEASTLIQVFDDLRVDTGTLRMAVRKLKEDGLTPNLETLKLLSAEYLELETPVERNTFLFDNFGRAGIELQRVMEAGPAVLDEYAQSAADAGLVVDQEFVDEMEDARLKIDEFNDMVDAAKLKVGYELVSAFVDGTNFQETFRAAVEAGIITNREYGEVMYNMQHGIMDMSDATDWLAQKTDYANMIDEQRIAHLKNEYPQVDKVTEAVWGEEMALRYATTAAENWGTSHQEQIIDKAGDIRSAIDKVTGGLDYEKLITGQVEEAIKLMSDSEVEAARMKLALKLATEELTAAEIEELLNKQTTLQYMTDLNQAYKDGTINEYDYFAALADGNITTDEYNTLLGITVEEYEDIIPVQDDAEANTKSTSTNMALAINEPLEKVGELVSKYDSLKDKSVVITVDTYYTDHGGGGGGDEYEQYASGGPTAGGKPIIVGEQGPEMFVPNIHGTVIPASITEAMLAAYSSFASIPASQPISVGGGGTVNINMGGVTIANGMDEQAFLGRVEYAVARAMGA